MRIVCYAPESLARWAEAIATANYQSVSAFIVALLVKAKRASS